MFLAQVVAEYEDEFICDMAETYHVTNWRELPLKTSAVLAFGLSASSRTKQAITGVDVSDTNALLAIIADRLGVLCWQNTEDAVHGRNQPQSIYEKMLHRDKPERLKSFHSGNDFASAWERINGG